jgi:sterol desaturase/sphingolipid hydroxylase (fatty acid hydroxylase superfamily)
MNYAIPFTFVAVAVFCALDYLLLGRFFRSKLQNSWLLHLGLFISGQLVTILVPISSLLAGAFSQNNGWGVVPMLHGGFWLSFLSWGLAASLLEYVLHIAAHRYALLWAFHRVHHSDELVDATTGFRHHPIEMLWTAWLFGILGLIVAPALEAMLVWYFFTTAFNLLAHSHIKFSNQMSRFWEMAFFTPSLHRIHHSSEALQTNSNFGGTFNFWDRLFGTYNDEEPKQLGLDDPALSGKNATDFDTLLLEPFSFIRKRWKRR